MACMKVVRAFTIYEALSALDALLKQATAASDNESTFQPADNGHDPQAGPAQTGTRPHQPTLVVLDSLGALLTPVLGGTQHMQGHALLASAAMSLKQVAAALNAAVLVTNHMVGGGGWRDGGGGGGEKRPALGESWQNQAHSRLQLGLPANEGGPHTATLRASTIGAPGKVASFWLTAAGGVAGLPAPLAPPIPEGA